MFTKEVGRPTVYQHGKNMVFPGKSRPASRRILGFIQLSFLLGLCGCGGVNLQTSNTLVATPNSITFGAVALGKSAIGSVSLQNRGIAPVKISEFNFNAQSFSVNGSNTLPATVPPGATYILAIQFNPSTVGAENGQLVIGTDTTSLGATKIALSGSGAPGLSKLTCNLSTVSGSATDSCSITLNAAAGSGGLSVSLASSEAAVVLPSTVTVPANSTSASFIANVSPVNSPQSATLTASEGGSSSSFAVELGPNGSVAHEVQLNWDAPGSDVITGYKVYRSTGASSNYQLLTSSVVPDTSYTDTSAQSGETYVYVVESVDDSGAQSGPSNTTTVIIP
jgi:hypothetical protein